MRPLVLVVVLLAGACAGLDGGGEPRVDYTWRSAGFTIAPTNARPRMTRSQAIDAAGRPPGSAHGVEAALGRFSWRGRPRRAWVVVWPYACAPAHGPGASGCVHQPWVAIVDDATGRTPVEFTVGDDPLAR
jgi:hypothetical protein